MIGREHELGLLSAFLDCSADGPTAFVLEGEPGIGKSTLWLAGVEFARQRGMLVLSSRPAEAERGLAHVGLGDLFDDVVDDVVRELPMPRRRALEVALLREAATNDPVDQRALGVASRDVLHLLSEQKPTLLAIDDVQWLDASSSSALALALRRLAASRVLLLFARRLVDGAQPSAVEQALEAARVLRLQVGPLSLGALHRFLRERVDRTFARQTLLRIHEQSGGNPFYALELARALGARVDPSRPLPLPETLDELLRRRVSGLPANTRDALAVAAAAGTPSESLLERAGVTPDALRPALDAGVITRQDWTIRFTHPLLASVVYDPSVHARLAQVVDEPLARARHLALAQAVPNAGVARELDDAAALAMERGAAAVSAELAENALRLTPADERDVRRRRALAAARAHKAAGEWTRAQAIATDLLAETEPGPHRAEVLVFLADFEVDERAVPLLEQAAPEADPRLRLRIRILIAQSRRFTSGFAAAFDDVRAAVADAEQLDDNALRVLALSAAALLGRNTLDPDAVAYAKRARAIAVTSGDHELVKQSGWVLGQVLVDRGEYDEARASLELFYDDWRDRDEQVAAAALWSLAWLELWTGQFERAADCAARSHELSVQYGVEAHAVPLPGAWAAAYRGEFDRARELAERGLALCDDQIGIAGPLFPGVLGLVAFWSGDVPTGVEQFAEADRLARAVDWRNPHKRPWTADYIEALLELGRIGDAVRVLDNWEADALALDRPRILAQTTRCRGLVAAAEGRIDEAATLLERAVEQHEEFADTFGRARALHALGAVRRRQRQKRAARDATGEAAADFEHLGAAAWVEKTRSELGRIGGRTRSHGLTAAERRVAALVAEGRTNKEVAAALFLGERTIETHLSHVYAKLGVRSRAELARAYRSGAESAGQSSGGSTISS